VSDKRTTCTSRTNHALTGRRSRKGGEDDTVSTPPTQIMWSHGWTKL
jgi:hypothetical protein